MNENMRDDYRLIIEGDKKRVVKQGDIKDKKYEPYICPRTGKPFDDKTRGPFWNFVRPHLKPKLMKSYDISIILEKEEYKENLDKLFHKCDIEYLYKEYFKGIKIGEKKLENLIGLIDLEVLIILVKILREEATFEDYINNNEEVESVEEESVEEVESVEEIETVSDENKEETVEEENTEMIIDDNNTENSMNYIDLFSGIGGFHQALNKLDCKCILACDVDNACRENYKLNYGIEPHPDVRKINPEEIDDRIDIICGGFPCQAFSNAGKKKMFEDDRGLLFDEIIRIANVKKPKFMFLENVKHILKVGDKKVIEYIKQKLDKNDYVLQLFEISPHHYGVPQQRDRVYFVCVRKDIYNGKDVELPPKIKDFKFEDFLDNKEDIDSKYLIEGDILKCLNAWEEMIKIFSEGEKISPTIMINEHYNNHTEEEFNNYASWRKDYITKNKPLIEKYKPQWDKWYEKNKKIIQKREIYGKLEWQAGPIKENDSIWNYFIQIRQSGIRVKRAHHFPTLVAISQIPIYGKEKRYITPRECSRLQSFPEDFKIAENDRHSYKQFGNAVNVNNVHTVIKATFDHYEITNNTP